MSTAMPLRKNPAHRVSISKASSGQHVVHVRTAPKRSFRSGTPVRGSATRSRRRTSAAQHGRRVAVSVRSESGHPRGAVIRTVAPNLKRIVLTVLFALFLAFGLIYAWTATGPNYEPVPETTRVVAVRPGESLTTIAQNNAPDAAVSDVVARIVQLNNLNNSGLQSGQLITVPVDVDGAATH